MPLVLKRQLGPGGSPLVKEFNQWREKRSQKKHPRPELEEAFHSI
jgi:hypothetical protein